MSAKPRLLLTLLAVSVAGPGCVTCQYGAHARSVEACHASPIPTPIRQHVYLFMMNGYDLLDLGGLSTLRDGVIEAGFPKVYFAQRADRRWFEYEIRRLSLEDPNARFVVLGMGAAADQVVPLVVGAVADGLAVDGLILLDPIGCPPITEMPVPTLTLLSRHWATRPAGIPGETRLEFDLSHLGLPKAMTTLAIVLEQLSESASRVGPLDGPAIPVLPLSDKPTPLPRPRELNSDDATTTPDEWDFLKRSAPIPTPLSWPDEVPPTRTAIPAIPVSRSR